MAYSELIKKFEKIRSYMRRFYVYGFWHRGQYDMKSARSYDNERRRVESWLADYVSFRQEASGKVVFLSVDGRSVAHNPFYNVFKAKSFTANDITLHFYLMDILADGEALTVQEILARIEKQYFRKFRRQHDMVESTLRKKLQEYEREGLVERAAEGRRVLYRRVQSEICLEKWADAAAFYSEADSMGVIGSFLLDKLPEVPEYYGFKHHFLLHALDSEVLYALLTAMSNQADVRLKVHNPRGSAFEFTVHPVKIYVSTQDGRRFLLAWDDMNDRPWFYRLDNILEVNQIEACGLTETYDEKYEEIKKRLWGVSLGDYDHLEHLEMTVFVGQHEEFIIQRLEREKRGGIVEKISPELYRFSIDVYDALEMMPWIRTFTGRIRKLECSNPEVTDRFRRDLKALYDWYGGEKDAVQ